MIKEETGGFNKELVHHRDVPLELMAEDKIDYVQLKALIPS